MFFVIKGGGQFSYDLICLWIIANRAGIYLFTPHSLNIQLFAKQLGNYSKSFFLLYKIADMKNLLIIVCLEMLVFSCSSIHKCDSNSNNMSIFGQRYELQVRNFSKIPKDLLENIGKIGIDSFPILNEYEGRYFNYIFKINPQDFNLAGKKVGFLESKTDYFKNMRSLDRNFTIVGGSSLYIFDAVQKEESGGYDAAIVYWSKFVIPIEEVVKRLKR